MSLLPLKLSGRDRILAFLTGEILVPSFPVLDQPIHEMNSLTLEKWQGSSERVKWASEQMQTRYFREMIGTLQNISVSIRDPAKLDGTTSAYLLGYMQGLKMQVINILAMAQSPKQPLPEIEADYSEPQNIEELEPE